MKKLYKTILVDDDATCVFIAQMVIKKAGITQKVYTAENGKQALEMIERSCQKDYQGEDACCPELILLDLNMPIMNGFEFLDALDQRWGLNPQITKIYLLTSSTNPNDVEKAKRYAIAGYIEKPLTLEKINSLGL
jgi:CheY-like chemotaxis protein